MAQIVIEKSQVLPFQRRWVAFVCLSAMDIATTAYALVFRRATESNPLFSWIENIAWLLVAFVAAKLLVIGILSLVRKGRAIGRNWYALRPSVLNFAYIVTGLVVLWNISQIVGLW